MRRCGYTEFFILRTIAGLVPLQFVPVFSTYQAAA
eukprot:COSAG02_NODE_60000_length_272_cov_1.069364_1_plen_34_part_10